MAWLAVETAHPEQHESLRRVQRNAPGGVDGVYSFAQLGKQPDKPGCLKSEAVAYPSELFP
jgi:hypothetical protein